MLLLKFLDSVPEQLVLKQSLLIDHLVRSIGHPLYLLRHIVKGIIVVHHLFLVLLIKFVIFLLPFLCFCLATEIILNHLFKTDLHYLKFIVFHLVVVTFLAVLSLLGQFEFLVLMLKIFQVRLNCYSVFVDIPHLLSHTSYHCFLVLQCLFILFLAFA